MFFGKGTVCLQSGRYAYRVRLHLVLYLKMSIKLGLTPAKSCSHRTCRLVACKEVHLSVVSVLERVDRWLTGHFGTKTFRHQDSSAPVQNGAEVSRDNSAPDFLLVPNCPDTLVPNCPDTSAPVPKYRHHPSKIHMVYGAIVSSE